VDTSKAISRIYFTVNDFHMLNALEYCIKKIVLELDVFVYASHILKQGNYLAFNELGECYLEFREFHDAAARSGEVIETEIRECLRKAMTPEFYRRLTEDASTPQKMFDPFRQILARQLLKEISDETGVSFWDGHSSSWLEANKKFKKLLREAWS